MKPRAPTLGFLVLIVGVSCAFTSRPMIPGATGTDDAGVDDGRNNRDASVQGPSDVAAYDAAAYDAAAPSTGLVDRCPDPDDPDAGDAGDVRDVPLYLRDGAPCDPNASRDGGVRDGSRDGDSDASDAVDDPANDGRATPEHDRP